METVAHTVLVVVLEIQLVLMEHHKMVPVEQSFLLLAAILPLEVLEK